ncbi:dnaJ homolog subfamily C member 4-like [Tigriopus californicus]|uniref:dnaJ homolog subfamily C member 4-like n=1 Tax=Tigriopus californicus TaxID=6832 RepID=UPI0027DA5021|nr:dnaJ homolog subfamily C member 4-like [Tigriopus californicus]
MMGWTWPMFGPMRAQGAKRTLTTIWSLTHHRGRGPGPWGPWDPPGPPTTQLLSTTASKWNSTPTHYEVLGLSREATPKEIKDAYLNLSKAYHPDMNAALKSSPEGPTVTPLEQEARNRARNTHFMAINEAYSILSKPKDRHIYDLGLYREHPVGSQPHQASGPYRTMYREPMSFDERAELFGFKTPDPNFYRSSRMNYMVAFGCICFAVAGYLIHMNIARMVYDKHNLEMEKTNQKLWQEMDDFDKARLEFTAKYPTREESRKELMRRFADYETTTINRARS